MRTRFLQHLGSLVALLMLASSALADMVELVHFKHAPFPFAGNAAERRKFFDVLDGARRGHTGRDGTVYWEDETYHDDRVLLGIPSTFDPKRRPVLVVFLHGNQSLLDRDVRQRQRVPAQIAAARLNALLITPQFAADALDSGAGKFARPGAVARFLDESADKLDRMLRLYLGRRRARPNLHTAPIVLVAYSGGYLPAAYALADPRVGHRVRSVILLDALYGNEPQFATWIKHHHADASFFSAYTESTEAHNEALQQLLQALHITPSRGLPARLWPGSVSFVPLGAETDHVDLLSQAWAVDPLTDILRRVSLDPPRKIAEKKADCRGRQCKFPRPAHGKSAKGSQTDKRKTVTRGVEKLATKHPLTRPRISKPRHESTPRPR